MFTVKLSNYFSYVSPSNKLENANHTVTQAIWQELGLNTPTERVGWKTARPSLHRMNF